MARLDELYQLSVKLDDVLNKVTNDNREEMIEEITRLIDAREKVIRKIERPYSADEIEIGKKIVELNKTIEKNLEAVFAQLRREMKQIQQQKKSNRSYINPYGSIKSVDGMYVDSKQ